VGARGSGSGAARHRRALRGPVAAAVDRKEPRGAESHGWLSAKDGASIYRDALVDVVFRGFEELGVDLGPTRTRAEDRSILAR
jgi:hypothetical protein